MRALATLQDSTTRLSLLKDLPQGALVGPDVAPGDRHDDTWSLKSVVVVCCGLMVMAGILIQRYKEFLLYVVRFLKLKFFTYLFLLQKKTLPDVFEDVLSKFRHRPALIFERETWTFEDLEIHSNRVARWLMTLNLPKRSCIALLMESRPEFIMFWLGAAKIDLKIALINATMRGKSLLHSIQESEAKALIYGAECQSNVTEILPSLLQSSMALYFAPDARFPVEAATRICSNSSSTSSSALLGSFKFPRLIDSSATLHEGEVCRTQARVIEDLTPLINGEVGYSVADIAPVSRTAREGRKPHDPIFLIFTSGTTGLPKAAQVSHTRIFMAGLSFALFHNVTEKDTIYCPLPLYHSAAGLLGVGMSWSVGAPIVIKRKFSASTFFRDCFEYNVTVIQYIGQLCRYLLATPPSPFDTRHCIKKAIGNGLRKDVWIKFKKRFKIPYIGEFYGSTEGNATLINTMNKVGACGYLPHITTLFYPAKLIRVVGTDMEPVRGPDGLCIECDYDEPGELLGKITSDPLREFTGYTREAESKKKILENVFRHGDKWFRTGDLLRKDKDGFLYFVDRLGDTFRWKGENCACNQVESVMAALRPVDEVVVYGVPIPGYEDKAGMACVILKGGYSLVTSNGDVVESSLFPGDATKDLATNLTKFPVETDNNVRSRKELDTESVDESLSHHESTASPTRSVASAVSFASSLTSSVTSGVTSSNSTAPCIVSISETGSEPAVTEPVRMVSPSDELLDGPIGGAKTNNFVSSTKLSDSDATISRGKEHNTPAIPHPAKQTLQYTQVSFRELYREMCQHLAKWQIPVFLRITVPGGIETTATFKPNKTRLMGEGFDPSRVNPPDALFVCDERAETYVPLTPAIYNDIIAGRRRL